MQVPDHSSEECRRVHAGDSSQAAGYNVDAMDIIEFRQSLAADSPPPGMSALLQALWHDAKGGWQRAHEIVQAIKGKQSARVHAYLHRKEGDLDNAGYWHARAGSTLPDTTLEQEWEALAVTLLDKETK